MSIILLTEIVNGTGAAQQMGNYDWHSETAAFDVVAAEIMPTTVATPYYAMLTLNAAGRGQLAAMFRTVRAANGNTTFVPIVKGLGIQLGHNEPVTVRIDFMDQRMNVMMQPYNANCVMQLAPC